MGANKAKTVSGRCGDGVAIATVAMAAMVAVLRTFVRGRLLIAVVGAVDGDGGGSARSIVVGRGWGGRRRGHK
jgi:hypothetical protein